MPEHSTKGSSTRKMLIKIAEGSENLEQYSELINKLAEMIQDSRYVADDMFPVLKNSYCSLMSVSKSEIQEINKETRDIDKVTDILSFPMLDWKEGKLKCSIDECDYEIDNDGNRTFNLGDIVLCYDVAVEQSEEYGHSLEREVLFLIAHSLLHLLGYDHEQPKDEKKMLSKQKYLMADLGLSVPDDEVENDSKSDKSVLDEPVYPPTASIMVELRSSFRMTSRLISW